MANENILDNAPPQSGAPGENNPPPAGDETHEGGDGAPEGIPAELWDADSNTLIGDKVAMHLKALSSERDSFKKQADDFHRKYSKAHNAPENADEYAKGYAPPEDYRPVLEAKDTDMGKFVSDSLSALDKFAYENALSIPQAEAVKNEFLRFSKSIWPDQFANPAGDPAKAAEAKAKAEERYKSEIESILGPEYADVLQDNGKFLESYGRLSDGEREWLKEESKSNPKAAAVVYRLRSLFEGSGSAMPVHGSSGATGLADDRTLNARIQDMIKGGKEYGDPEIQKIIADRLKAGRPVEFQL
ncbi:MAG: hypothetical protein LBO78_01980 [Rickettsiales bacterium]|nr:hypothetical protein [Rickettsiales bacterium]